MRGGRVGAATTTGTATATTTATTVLVVAYDPQMRPRGAVVRGLVWQVLEQ
jgi:hypothetical protein